MPSRQPPYLSDHHHHNRPHLVPPLAAGTGIFATLVLFFLCLCRKLRKKPKSPTPSIRRFSYSSLRRATSSFSPTTRLGQGGVGSVHLATLQNQKLAVKLMESGSLQGEREFQNEIIMAEKMKTRSSRYVLSLLGFASKRHSMLLVYEYMCNGSLQDALIYRKDVRLRLWENRFVIALDVARGIEYLHGCDPPTIHCDIKPSNILLDGDLRAKIGDFGLARFKEEKLEGDVVLQVEMKEGIESRSGGVEDNLDTESVTSVTTVTGLEDFSACMDQSPESFGGVTCGDKSPARRGQVAVLVSPEKDVGAASVESPLKGNNDGVDVECVKKIQEIGDGDAKSSRQGKTSFSQKDGSPVPTNGIVKDYVIEWIGTELRNERPKSDWIGASSSSMTKKDKMEKKKKNRRQLEWWMSLDDEQSSKKQKRRPVREWWKEEYCKELAKKQKKKKKRQMGIADDNDADNYWPRDDDLYTHTKKKSREGSRNSRGNLDRWLDGLSGELWRGRPNSYDSASGEIPRSGAISTTPSMRGTVCYVAPEYGGAGFDDFSEKCDVYSYGVLLLVLVAGRRPLQITGSPISEFKRANLISWARHLARTGKLIDLADKSIESLDKEQALRSIKVALLCLQKLPTRRPSMKEVVGMLLGDLEVPQLPHELFRSPPSRFPVMSQKNACRV